MLSSDELRRRVPRASPSLRGGVFFPEDAHLDPERLVLALARRARSLGARIETGHEVLAFERAGRRIAAVVTTRGDVRAERFVLATGAWSPPVAALLVWVPFVAV